MALVEIEVIGKALDQVTPGYAGAIAVSHRRTVAYQGCCSTKVQTWATQRLPSRELTVQQIASKRRFWNG